MAKVSRHLVAIDSRLPGIGHVEQVPQSIAGSPVNERAVLECMEEPRSRGWNHQVGGGHILRIEPDPRIETATPRA
jgi:hypothetical protein